MPKPTPTPLDDFLNRLMSEVVIPNADFLTESVAGYFERMMNQAEKKSRALPKPKKERKGKKVKPEPVKRTVTAYDVLGVSPTAPQEVLQAAYKALARMYHPDVSKYHSGESKMKIVTQAWEQVKTPELRKKYDREIGL